LKFGLKSSNYFVCTYGYIAGDGKSCSELMDLGRKLLGKNQVREIEWKGGLSETANKIEKLCAGDRMRCRTGKESYIDLERV
jgi:hypothetical protein